MELKAVGMEMSLDMQKTREPYQKK